jgi:hypothetical protein
VPPGLSSTLRVRLWSCASTRMSLIRSSTRSQRQGGAASSARSMSSRPTSRFRSFRHHHCAYDR